MAAEDVLPQIANRLWKTTKAAALIQ